MFVKSVNFLPASIKSMNPMQKYPHITELFACTQKMLAIIFFITNKFFNFFRNMFNTKTIDINNLNFCCKIKQSNTCLHLHIYQGLLRMPHFFFIYFFRQVIS